MKILTGMLLLVTGALAGSGADAADIKEQGQYGSYPKFVVSGPIREGDLKLIEKAIGEREDVIVALNSRGGSYQESLRIAQFFHEKPARTLVENGAECFSACAIAFLGGAELGAEGWTFVSRTLAPRGRLGFHAPYLDLTESQYTREFVERAYDRAVKSITDFVAAAGDLGVTPAAAAAMMAPQRNSLYLVDSVERVQTVGMNVDGLVPPARFTESMARNLCRNAWNWIPAVPVDELVPLEHDRIGWSLKKSTYEIKSDYFGEGLAVRRTIFPIGGVIENGMPLWCVLDRATVDGSLDVACRGFVEIETLKEAVRAARDTLDKPVAGKLDYECAVIGEEETWGLVPPDTRLDAISGVLDKYVADEPRL